MPSVNVLPLFALSAYTLLGNQKRAEFLLLLEGMLLINHFYFFLLQALFLTIVQLVRKHFMYYPSKIDEQNLEIEDDVVLDDSMFASFTEKNFEDVGCFHKLLLLTLHDFSACILSPSQG